MADFKAFKGLRYNMDTIGSLRDVTTPPYDIISEQQQKEFYLKHPFNVIRLEFGKDEENDDENSNKYTRAADTLNEWLESMVLEYEDKDAFYIYGQEFTLEDGRTLSYKGILGLVKIEEFSKGIILPHEETLSKAKTDRYNLISRTNSNFSPIYSLYMDDSGVIPSDIERLSQREPDISFKAVDGVTQKLWIVKDEEDTNKITSEFKNKQLFIADGHHRYETSLNYRNAQREKKGKYDKNDNFNYVMMFLVEMDAPGLVVFPTYRMLKDIQGFNPEKIAKSLENSFSCEKRQAEGDPCREITKELEKEKTTNIFAMYTGKGEYYLLKLRDKEAVLKALEDKSDAYKNLDVTVLHAGILEKAFGIDSENMKNQKNLTYTRDAEYAVSGVDSGEYCCSFFLNPTKIKEIKDVSLAGEKMPQKSTYFYPKLITGIVMNKFE